MTPVTTSASAVLERAVPVQGWTHSSASQWTKVIEPDRDWDAIVVERLSQLQDLPLDWDMAASPRITRESVGTAIRLLFVFSRLRSKLGVPFIGPISGGGLGIQFEEGGRELEIEVYPDGRVGVLQTDGGRVLVEEDMQPSLESLRGWVDWLEYR